QSVLGKMFDLTSGKLEHQNELLRLNARLTAIKLRAEADAQRTNANDVFRTAGTESVGGIIGSFFSQVGPANPFDRIKMLDARAIEQRKMIEAIQKAPNEDARSKAAEAAIRYSEKADFSG